MRSQRLLCPPLCVVGVGLAFGNFGVAIGGALLFLANLIAINLAAAIIFKLMGFSINTAQTPVDPDNQKTKAVVARQHRNRFVVSVVAFIIISVPLSFFMYSIITTTQTDNTIKAALEADLESYSNVEFVSYSYEYTDGEYDVNIVVNAERKPTREDLLKIQAGLADELNAPVEGVDAGRFFNGSKCGYPKRPLAFFKCWSKAVRDKSGCRNRFPATGLLRTAIVFTQWGCET